MLVVVSLVLLSTNLITGEVLRTRTLAEQIDILKAEGFDPAKLDGNTQLRVFLYTWLGMERGEGG